VLNMEDSVAVTQNFASTSSFPAVWADTRKGRTKLARTWLKKLKKIRPDLYQIAQVRP
jgi:histone arginine demethylase JMJD6